MLRLRALRALGHGVKAASSRCDPSYNSTAHVRDALRNTNYISSSSFSAQPEVQEAVPSSPITSPSSGPAANIDAVFDYHERSKHHPDKYAESPADLKWEEQPRPFRRYRGSPGSSMRHLPPIYGAATDQQYSRSYSEFVNPCILTKASLSQLMYDSFSVSAWKKGGPSQWHLRVNPSCGNLHPTEIYMLCPPLAGVGDSPFIAHYYAREHTMEVRAEIPFELWRDMTNGFPPGTMFVAFASIFWRQAWKYGERGYRYCQQDIGHAMGAVTMAGAAMGWDSILLDGWGTEDLDHLLGLAARKDIPPGSPRKGYYPELEQEHAHCIVAFHPSRAHQEMTVRGKPDYSARSRPRDDSIYKMSNVSAPIASLLNTVGSRMAGVEWKGLRNKLSNEHVWWDIIDKTAAAVSKPAETRIISTKPMPPWMSFTSSYLNLTLRQVLHKRRSLTAVDNKWVLQRESFYQMMWKTMPTGYNNEVQGEQIQFPFRVLAWRTEIHLAIFVHKVSGLAKGLYFLCRNNEHEQSLRKAMRPEFKWEKPEKCPQHLHLYLLAESNCELLSKQINCEQDIAADSCFTVAMIGRLDVLKEKGAWMYPRLLWESGLLGQLLYLEAHAIGISGAGIGSYFDDKVHNILGLRNKEFQKRVRQRSFLLRHEQEHLKQFMRYTARERTMYDIILSDFILNTV
ncbi:hypothetical protein GOP47_0030304 [Adiantum capillus-veneris]|nr:hypothetical protein GOP47_0030304 [Adiantum capillus-veneris]